MKEKKPEKQLKPKKVEAASKASAPETTKIEAAHATRPSAARETAKKVETKKERVAKTPKKVTTQAPGEDIASPHGACQIQSCKRPYRAKGYCRVHYKKWRHGEYGRARYKVCKENECRFPVVMNRHGYCEEHFQKYYVRGEALPVVAAPAKTAEKAVEKPHEKVA